MNLVKNDEKLFKGLFYIAIKDVDVSNLEELKYDFRVKLLQICKRSHENFLTKNIINENIIKKVYMILLLL